MGMGINMLGAIFIITLTFRTEPKLLIGVRFFRAAADGAFMSCQLFHFDHMLLICLLPLYLGRRPEALTRYNEEYQYINIICISGNVMANARKIDILT